MAAQLDWRSVDATPAIPAHAIYTKPIEKPETDDRDYRLIRLQNGLHALLIHDAKADKAGAALNVGVGHLSDPDDIPGLAHFCEHLCFMGSAQFPKENEYSEFIQKHGGRTNAYTAASSTNYYFHVGSNHLEGAIQRFSGFFHSPRFDASSTSREINAVNSENKQNLQSDPWRLFQLSKHLSSSKSPWRKFGTGSSTTLTQHAKAKQRQVQSSSTSTTENGALAPTPLPSRGPSPTPSELGEGDGGFIGQETRRRVIEWWEANYCASHMNLAILGKESLDELTRIVADNFSAAVNRSYKPSPTLAIFPWDAEQRGTLVYAKSVKDTQSIEFCWEMSDQDRNYEAKPINVISHLVGHEGPGSLHAYLKSKGWITYLSAGFQSYSSDYGMFKVNIGLTKSGLGNWKNVVAATYSFLSLLRSEEIPEFHYQEYKALGEMGFRFADKPSPGAHVLNVADLLGRTFPKDRVLSARWRIWKEDHELVRQMLHQDLLPQRSRITLVAKDFTPAGIDGQWEKEPWYGTEYQLGPIDPAILSKALEANAIPELRLPGINDFLATNFSVGTRTNAEPSPAPVALRETPLSTLWHKKDDQFYIPKGTVSILVESPLATVTARNMAMTILTVALIQDALNEYAYNADVAGLRFSLAHRARGFEITVSGYNDKMPVLLKAVLEKARNLVIPQDRFAVILEQTKQAFENFGLSQPAILADFYTQHGLTDVSWTPEEQLEEMPTITVDDMHTHLANVWSRIKLTTLVHGNFTQEDALKIQDLVEEICHSRHVTPGEIVTRPYILPEGSNFVYKTTVPNPKEANSDCLYLCQLGDLTDDSLRARSILLESIIKEPCFDFLRTKEQLGYNVRAAQSTINGYLSLYINVQSERSPVYVETRIEAFLDYFKGLLEKMEDEDFKKHRAGVVARLSERLDNLKEEYSRFINHIHSGHHDFQRRERSAKIISTLTLPDILEFFNKYIHYSSPVRRKLSLHLQSVVPRAPQAPPTINVHTPKHLSVPASQAFLQLIKQKNVPILDEAQYIQLCASHPPVADFKKFFQGYLANVKSVSEEVKSEILQSIEKFAREHPLPGEEEAGEEAAKGPGKEGEDDETVIIDDSAVTLREGWTEVKDLNTFKLGLTLGKSPTPYKPQPKLTNGVVESTPKL